MRRILSGLLTGAMALAIVAGFSTKADAAFQLAVCNDPACLGGNDYFVTDNGLNNSLGLSGDTNPTADRIGVSGSFAGLNFTVLGSFSLDPSAPLMDINWLADGGPGSLWIYATDTDFTTVGGFSARLSGTLNLATATGTVSGGDENTQLNLAPNLATIPCADPGCFTTTTGSVGGPAPYSLTLGVALTHSGASSDSSGDFRVQVPEPASMALFGLGLLGFGAARRRRIV